jgi:hypothetical protein
MTEETKKPAEATAQTAPANPAPAQEAPVELTVQDLGNIKQIIDVASQRGAFKPNEMTIVGTTYTKLETFLNAVAAQQKAAQPAAQGDK